MEHTCKQCCHCTLEESGNQGEEFANAYCTKDNTYRETYTNRQACKDFSNDFELVRRIINHEDDIEEED